MASLLSVLRERFQEWPEGYVGVFTCDPDGEVRSSESTRYDFYPQRYNLEVVDLHERSQTFGGMDGAVITKKIFEGYTDNKWFPIESIPNDQLVDVWVASRNNPEWGIRICNVCKTDKHSAGWTGIEKQYLTDDIYPVYWMFVAPPKHNEEK